MKNDYLSLGQGKAVEVRNQAAAVDICDALRQQQIPFTYSSKFVNGEGIRWRIEMKGKTVPKEFSIKITNRVRFSKTLKKLWIMEA